MSRRAPAAASMLLATLLALTACSVGDPNAPIPGVTAGAADAAVSQPLAPPAVEATSTPDGSASAGQGGTRRAATGATEASGLAASGTATAPTDAGGTAPSTPTASAPNPATAPGLESRATPITIGQAVTIRDGGRELARFTITGVDRDPVCDNDPNATARTGRFVAVHVRLDSGPRPAVGGLDLSFDATNWSYAGPDGSGTRTGLSTMSATDCLGYGSRIKNPILADDTQQGSVVMEVPDTDGGTLTFEPYGGHPELSWSVPTP